MSAEDSWIIQLGDRYLKHPSGPHFTKDPAEAHGCHYKAQALEYLEEFAYLLEEPYNKSGRTDRTVTRRKDAKLL